MLVKGIIKKIDYEGNTCTVRIPTFESHKTDEYVVSAAISNQPGCYNGYKEGDVVWIGFDTDQYNQPVVLGKLYLGAAKEKEDPRGVVNAEITNASTSATIPFDTKLSNIVDPNIPNTQATYTSLQKLSNQVNETSTSLEKATTDFGNRITQLVTDTDNTGAQYKSLIQQTAREINAKVTKETTERIAGEEEIKTTASAELKETAANIQATVENKVDTASGSTSKGFGWSLSANDWKVFATADVAGMTDAERQDLISKSELLVQGETTNSIRTDSAGNPIKDDSGEVILDTKTENYFYVNGVKTAIKTTNSQLGGREDSELTVNDVELTLEKLEDEVYYWKLINKTDNTKSLIVTVTDAEGDVKYSANTKPILIATKNGLSVTGTITATDGQLGKFIIGKESTAEGAAAYQHVSGITADNFVPNKYYTNMKTIYDQCFVKATLSWQEGTNASAAWNFDPKWQYKLTVSLVSETGAECPLNFTNLHITVRVAGWSSTSSKVDSTEHTFDIYAGTSTVSTEYTDLPNASTSFNPTITYFHVQIIRDDPSTSMGPYKEVWQQSYADYITYATNPISITAANSTGYSTGYDGYTINRSKLSYLDASRSVYQLVSTYDENLADWYYYDKVKPTAIYSSGYLDTYGDQITSFSQTPKGNSTGIYVGTDGLRLGPDFSVSASGVVTAPAISVQLSDTQSASLINSMKQINDSTTTYGIGTTTEQPTDWYSSVEELSAKAGGCIWSKTVLSYIQNGTLIYDTPSYAIMGIGADGKDGTNGKDGANGYSVSSETIYLYQGTTANVAPSATTASDDKLSINIGDWSTDILEPTVAYPYIWITNYTKVTEIKDSVETITYLPTETVSQYATLAGYVDILSANGIGIISTSLNSDYNEETMPDYKKYLYNIKADTITGAIGNQVNIGGQVSYTKLTTSDTFDANTTYYYNTGAGAYQVYTTLTAENFAEKIASTEGVYVKGLLNGWAIKSADTIKGESAAIYSGNITEFKDASSLTNLEDTTGVYIGTDGIRLGNKFSVDATGQVSATGLKINLTDEQTSAIVKSIKQYDHTEYFYGKGTASTEPISWYKTLTEVNASSGDYIWTWTKTYYNDSTSTDSYSVEHLAENGDTVTTDTIYKLGDTSPSAPSNQTTTIAPSLPEGWSATPQQATKKTGEHYCYVCDVTVTHTKDSDSYSTTYSPVTQFSSYTGIVSIITRYLQTNTNYTSSEITKIEDGWTEVRPDNKAGYYVWTRIATTYVDTSLDTKEYYCDYTATSGAARNIDLTTTANVVKKTVLNGTVSYEPEIITLTCTLSDDAVKDKYNLNFKVPNSTDDYRTDQTAAIQTKQVSSSTLFEDRNVAEISATYSQGDTITLTDNVSIAVLIDGANGTDGLAILLTNPTITLRGDESGVTADQTETSEILVYSGSERLTADKTAAMYYSIDNIDYDLHSVQPSYDSSTKQYTIELTSKQTTTLSGSITIPVLIYKDSVLHTTQNLYLKWTTAQKGKTGDTGVSISTSNIYFYYANTSSTWDSTKDYCPTLTYSEETGAYADEASNWSTNEITPSSAKPYVWQWARTVTITKSGTEGTNTTKCEDAKAPMLFNSLDGLVSILSADGIDIISKETDADTQKDIYHIKADTLTGAVSNSVTIGGFTIRADEIKTITNDDGTTEQKTIPGAIYSGGKNFENWSKATSTDESEQGICISSEGIKLGSSFSVDKAGNVTGTSFKTIDNMTTTYAVGSSMTTHPDESSFSNTIPETTTSNPYLWSKSVTNYTNNTQSDPVYAVSTRATPGCNFIYDENTSTLTIEYFTSATS